jgi:hypothetical protein
LGLVTAWTARRWWPLCHQAEFDGATLTCHQFARTRQVPVADITRVTTWRYLAGEGVAAVTAAQGLTADRR